MTWVVAAVWGAVGAILLDLVEIGGSAKTHRTVPWKLPGEPSLGILLFSVVIRVLFAAGVVGALGASGDICTEIQALIAGAAAPILFFEKLGTIVKGAR